MKDMIDHVMEVMEEAFDPAYGEAWNRRQVTDALLMGNCNCMLLDSERNPLGAEAMAAGFILSRQAADEEEILLIAVRPHFRRHGIATCLLEGLVTEARQRDVTRLFLEMREGNPAEALYRSFGFVPVGRRPNYYNRGSVTGLAAITYALSI